MSQKRENWGSQLGLILAMAGNAVGLGNFWRFPYMATKNGGGAFMVPYIIALLVMGIPVMYVEWMQGRFGGKHGHGTLGFMVYLQTREKIRPKKAIILGSVLGAIVIGVTVLVNSYYNHIIGWTLGYSFLSATGGYADKAVSTGAIFTKYVTSPEYVFIFWVISLGCLAFAVTRGIQKGIEAWAKVMMPVLYVFGFILIFKALTVGAPVKAEWSSLKGLNFLWQPDWSKLFKFDTILAAAGQIFFTLSIGMGIIQNYASYLKADDDIILSATTTVALNEFAEVILGGTIAIPIAYAFLGDEGIAGSIGLSFIALPNVFRTMGGGQIMGTLWFLLLFFAGFTSAIAMYNYLVSILSEDMGMARKKASILVFFLYIVVGLPVCLETITTKTAEFLYFSEVDNWVGTYLLVVVGLLEVIIAGWLMKDDFIEEINRGSYWKLPRWFYTIIVRFVTPIAIMVVLAGSTYNYFKDGYFSLIPPFVKKAVDGTGVEVLKYWFVGARVVVLSVLVLGFIVTYRSIKSKYKDEILSGKVSIGR